MAGFDGTWDCVVRTPLGDQQLRLALETRGDSFTGTASGALGSTDLSGRIDGDAITWKQNVTKPMTLTLDCRATVEGDLLKGSVGAGVLGEFPLTGTRAG